jgi:hypothetical protein
MSENNRLFILCFNTFACGNPTGCAGEDVKSIVAPAYEDAQALLKEYGAEIYDTINYRSAVAIAFSTASEELVKKIEADIRFLHMECEGGCTSEGLKRTEEIMDRMEKRAVQPEAASVPAP